jgi:hypothetical protein
MRPHQTPPVCNLRLALSNIDPKIKEFLLMVNILELRRIKLVKLSLDIATEINNTYSRTGIFYKRFNQSYILKYLLDTLWASVIKQRFLVVNHPKLTAASSIPNEDCN